MAIQGAANTFSIYDDAPNSVDVISNSAYSLKFTSGSGVEFHYSGVNLDYYWSGPGFYTVAGFQQVMQGGATIADLGAYKIGITGGLSSSGGFTAATGSINHILFPASNGTNVSLSQTATNSSGSSQDWRGSYFYTTAATAVTGNAGVTFTVTGLGGVTNTLGTSTTIAVTPGMTVTNQFIFWITNGGTITPTQGSSGSGNTAGIVSNSWQVIQY